jgi:trimeric autotransporter adhesin
MKTTIPNCILSFLLLLLAVFLPAAAGVMAQNIDFGKSYINVTKGLNGGTVETGDTLEIRATLVVRSGTYDSCRFQDAVPAGTVYIPGTVRVLTNEGKIYKQFTDANGDDAGRIIGTNITINMGFNATAAPATAFRRGRVANTHKPSFFGSACILVASYRVRVTALTGSNISTGGGNMTYKLGAAAISTFTFPANTLRVFTNYGICSNSIGANSIGTEFNGTFGSGRPRNRGSSGNVPVGYIYSNFDANMPNDYYYGVANNTSTRLGYTTSNSWAIPDASAPSHRVFSLWDIIGDHTGAASPTLGNPASDTVANANGGYMLVINAAYRIDSAFQQTISGLCPNTYYEISCWMRNICSKCGCDSNGKGAPNTSGPPFYIPTAPGDSSGVAPNLTFEIDGIDYYTTGNIRYNRQWVKKGFTFLTGPTQTSFVLKFFNNAPGGGGNDWALDDIAVSTCSPNMSYSPSLTPIVCDSNALTIYDTVRSFFNNYTYYKWQRSTNGGATWTDVTAPSGPATPFWNGTAWQYVTSYTVPPAATLMSNAGDLYRLVVATTASNLSNASCSFTDVANIITLNIIDCGIPLAAQLISFNGQKNNGLAELRWTTADEEEALVFDIEKSTDGIHFSLIGSINSYEDYTSEQQQYSFTDPAVLTGKAYYRINMRNQRGQSTWSRTLQLSTRQEALSFVSVINPFSNELQVDIAAVQGSKAEADLIDASGKIVRHKTTELLAGITRIKFENTSGLAPGMYFLRIRSQDGNIQKTVLKTNQ